MGKRSWPPQSLFEEHVAWGRLHGNVAAISELPPDDVQATADRGRTSARKLRIGYVSPDFRQRAVAKFFEPVLREHDSGRFETFCYAELAIADKTTERLRRNADRWRYSTGLSDKQLALQIKADQIDILVDLAGHTAGNRLAAFAYRPAPIQVTWMGYPNTTGLEAMDYRLTCETQNPPDEPTYHVEELIRLKHGSFCCDLPGEVPGISPLPASRNGYVTFGSLHRPSKISEATKHLWAAVLQGCPTARLFAFHTDFTVDAAGRFRSSLMERGVDGHRIHIENTFDGASHLEACQNIDIGLDVTPWAGATTTMGALLMGVPVVALAGDRRSARSTAAIVKNVARGELIAHSFEQYVDFTTHLSKDWGRLAKLRQLLRAETESTIGNAERFTRDLESVFDKMCDKIA